MKKLFLIIAISILGLVAMGQTKTEQLSNYEKYLLAKEKGVQDTIIKYDTVYTEQVKPEYDDLYYTPSKDQLKLQSKALRLRKKEIRMVQDSLYYDAKKEVYDELSYSARIYRFHRPYYFPYFSYFWDPFYDPWFVDSWYWGYPYFGYPYYHSYWGFGYYNWYNDWRWNYPYYPNYYGHNYYGYNNVQNSSLVYGRRERSSIYSTSNITRRVPISINRTVEVDRRSGKVLGIQNQSRVSTTSVQRRTNTQVQRQSVSTINPNDRPLYNQQNRRTYTPTYQQPRLSDRPRYNNTATNRSYSSPSQNRSVITTQPRNSNSYSVPQRRSTPSNYSTPSRSSSYGGGSVNSRNIGSSYNGGSSVSRSSSGGSYSGGSSVSSNSSGGSRRK